MLLSCLSNDFSIYTFLVSARKVPKETAIGAALSAGQLSADNPVAALPVHWTGIHYRDCASLTRARAARPYVPHPAALTTPRSTLTYILSTTKMFRFLPCSGSASENRQAKKREFRRLSEDSSGLESFGGVVHRRGRLCKKPPPVPTSLVTFLFGDKKVIHIECA